MACILNCQSSELIVHFFVKVLPKEEGPEAEKSVHLLRLAIAQAFPLCNQTKLISLPFKCNFIQSRHTFEAPGAVFCVDLLCESIIFEKEV
jgi:hypothetical protein